MKTKIKDALRKIIKKETYTPSLINLYINKKALIHNLNQFKNIAGDREIAPVLKGNAYGHGLKEIGEILKDQKVPFFIIDSYFEAKALRNEGIKTPLLIIGYSSTDSIIKNSLKNISFTITSIEALRDLSRKINKKISIHIKIDTGMRRQGILLEEIREAIEIIKFNPNIYLEGVCSHFSSADDNKDSFTERQMYDWNNSIKIFKDSIQNIKYFHISATAGSVYREANANMIRLGIGLYGLMDIEGLNLIPILEMKTIISGIKKIKKGESVGYSGTYIAPKDMTIATIPVGYYEGIDRRLSNKGFVKIKNIFCPIIGKVSMNITVIDISRIESLKIGDEVIVISNKKEDKNSIENIARDCETISYEIAAVHIGTHLKRNVV
jgi:alanine racemase